ncbi:MAG: glycerate kinase [Oscillospiraceae bacterium]
MKKCIVISDSFKGSLPSRDICAIARERIPLYFPACEVRALNVADGGEGTVDCFLDSCGGERVLVSGVQNPYGEPIDAAYGLLPDGTAVVEMAAAAGLPLVAGRKNPCVTTTYGVGQLIADALARGARRIVLGLGGSATNDGGCGCAAALGVRFTDAGGKSFVPVGATLDRIAHIDASAVRERLHGVRVIAMCDITNPMHGHSGAAHIFAPQKGADEAAVRELDRQLRALDETFRRARLGRLPRSRRGGRVRRGLRRPAGRGTAPRHPGRARHDRLRRPAAFDLVITGEGASSAEHPAVVGGVARRAHARGVPVFAIVGDVGDDAYGAYDVGVSAIFSINRLAVPRDEAKARSHIDYTHTLDDLLRCIRAAEQFKR